MPLKVMEVKAFSPSNKLRDAARSNLAKGVDPAEQKQRDKRAALISAANSFEAVAKAYIAKNKRDGLAEGAGET